MEQFRMLCVGLLEFPAPLKQVNFAGWGEPLTNRELPHMIDTLKSWGLAENVAVITNGVLLTHEYVERLISAKVDHIRISLQGMTTEKYHEISGKRVDMGLFIERVSFLYKNKGKCKVSIKIADIALDGEDEQGKFYDTFGPITDQMYVEKIRPMFPQNEQDGRTISKYGIDHPPVQVCPQPFFMLSVTARGEILPCCNLHDPLYLGNIKDLSVYRAWNNHRLIKFQKMLLRKERKRNAAFSVCAKCTMPDAVLTPGDEMDERAEEILRRF
jgi:radical SAM protein with 4Fe4S-binding SPASM domain